MGASSSQEETGKVVGVAHRLIYIYFGSSHRFRAGDRVRVYRGKRLLGKWKILSHSSMWASAVPLGRGGVAVKVGDRAVGVPSGAGPPQAQEPVKLPGPEYFSRVWKGVEGGLGEKVRYRQKPGAFQAPSKVEVRYRGTVGVHYLGLFSRGETRQTIGLQSRFALETSFGLWHHHDVGLRFYLGREDERWSSLYRPWLQVNSLVVGYRHPRWRVALGRLDTVPAEAGLVDGVVASHRFAGVPLELGVFGGVEPGMADLSLRTERPRYGAFVRLGEWGWHRSTRLGFAGGVSFGKIDRQFLFAETDWSLWRWLQLSLHTELDLIPLDVWARPSPHISSLFLTVRARPWPWLRLSFQGSYYQIPASEALQGDMPPDFMEDAARGGGAGRLAFRLARDLWFSLEPSFGGRVKAAGSVQELFDLTGRLSYQRIARSDFDAELRYSYFRGEVTPWSHEVRGLVRWHFRQSLDLIVAYGLTLYQEPDTDALHQTHLINAGLDWLLPWKLVLSLAGEIFIGDREKGINAYLRFARFF